MYRPSKKPKRFDFPTGKSVAGKYVGERPLGSGWEGEVYVVMERFTGIRRGAKFYYPPRGPRGKAATGYARKLAALRPYPVLVQYHHPRPTRAKIHKDVLNLIQVFHTTVGGRKGYSKQPRVVKDIIRGLKDSLILARFQSAGDIQRHLETVEW